MNIMYVAPAYHPNQTPIVKGWVEGGDRVRFIIQYHMSIEDKKYTQAVDLGYSRLFRLAEKIYGLVGRGITDAYPQYFSDKCGFPTKRKLKEQFDEFRPDFVIVRERNFYSMMVNSFCKKRRIPCLLYNQTPLYDSEPPRNDLAHRIVKKLTPQIRYTPVYGDVNKGYLDENAHYIPFIMEPQMAPEERYGNEEDYSKKTLNILSVGKFEERKNHLMLVDVFLELVKSYNIRLTLVGNTYSNYHEEYLKRLKQYIDEKHLNDKVDIHVNIPKEGMDEFYRDADLFVIPSTAEFASVAQLEAMAYAMPVIASDTNGTSCYIKGNGKIFKDMDSEDLKLKIEEIISYRAGMIEMGKKSYELIIKEHSFSEYRRSILELINHK